MSLDNLGVPFPKLRGKAAGLHPHTSPVKTPQRIVWNFVKAQAHRFFAHHSFSIKDRHLHVKAATLLQQSG